MPSGQHRSRLDNCDEHRRAGLQMPLGYFSHIWKPALYYHFGDGELHNPLVNFVSCKFTKRKQ